MFNIIRDIINYTQSSSYTSTFEQYCWACCVGLILILTIVTCDWLRTLFKALVNKLR